MFALVTRRVPEQSFPVVPAESAPVRNCVYRLMNNNWCRCRPQCTVVSSDSSWISHLSTRITRTVGLQTSAKAANPSKILTTVSITVIKIPLKFSDPDNCDAHQHRNQMFFFLVNNSIPRENSKNSSTTYLRIFLFRFFGRVGCVKLIFQGAW